MKNLLEREQVVRTEYGSYCLEYRIHEIKAEGWDLYGISITQFRDKNKKEGPFDQAMIRAFTDSLKEARDFLETLIMEVVFPVHLYSIADDWQSHLQA